MDYERLVTISFTGLNDPGGVPKFNRDVRSAFTELPHQHFCWADFPHDASIPEWDRARVLNDYLLKTRKISNRDLIIADGFWAAGLEHHQSIVSVCHGIWGHVTKEDVDAGKQPDFPYHHAAQIAFRRRWLDLKKPMTVVSDFIAKEMRLQWGFEATVINNGIDLNCPFNPYQGPGSGNRNFNLIIHGATTLNKGSDHIDLLRHELPDMNFMILDDAARVINCSKAEALALASAVIQPSAFEGNSYFVLECLAANTPIIAYDVGLLWRAKHLDKADVGYIADRNERSPEKTLDSFWKFKISSIGINPREYAKQFSIERFRSEWRTFTEAI